MALLVTFGCAISAATWALSSVEERPLRMREVEGSNPSVSKTLLRARDNSSQQYPAISLSVAQLVEHVTVDVCDHRVAGSIPAAESVLVHYCWRGCSSNGRALAQHARGTGIDTLHLQAFWLGRGMVLTNAPRLVRFGRRLVARWPSGLRRCVKAAISSEAWVRTPPSSLFSDARTRTRTHTLAHTHTHTQRHTATSGGRVAQWKSVGPRIQRLQVRVLPRSVFFPPTLLDQM